jgi:hypothetical protein
MMDRRQEDSWGHMLSLIAITLTFLIIAKLAEVLY